MAFKQNACYKLNDKLPSAPLTVEAEIRVDPSITDRAGAILSNYTGIRQDWHFEIHKNGVPRFYYVNDSGVIKDYYFKNVDVRTGAWVHIALTFDFANRTMSIYIDGQLAQTLSMDSDLAPDVTTYRFVLGSDNRSNNGCYFKGEIKSLAAYSDVRSANEIRSSYENGTDPNAENLLLCYYLSVANEDNGVRDFSPNGFDIAKEWVDSNELENDYAYSFAVVGDTQWLSKYTPDKMEGLYDWLLENKDSLARRTNNFSSTIKEILAIFFRIVGITKFFYV
jgi:hypothetical protein